jgi:hypothetical protein
LKVQNNAKAPGHLPAGREGRQGLGTVGLSELEGKYVGGCRQVTLRDLTLHYNSCHGGPKAPAAARERAPSAAG